MPAACRVPGCEYAGQALGFCEGHYKRYLRAGRPGISGWVAAGPPVTPPDPTGTCLVPVPVKPGDRVHGDFGVLGKVSVSFA